MKKQWTGFQLNYDALQNADECQEFFALSRRTRDICIALLQYAEWPTRYHSPSGAPISKDVIDNWASSALAQLMVSGAAGVEEICMGSDFCTMVRECLESGSADSYFEQKKFEDGEDLGISGTTHDTPYGNAEMVEECDPDKIFGMTTQVVDLLHTIIWDFLQKLEELTNHFERVQLFVSSIPLVGQLPLDELFGMADQVIEEFYEMYLAGYDEDLRLGYRCDVFCLMMENCSFNLRDLGKYFLNRVGQDFMALDFGQFCQMIATGEFIDVAVVHALHGLACYSLAYGTEFLGVKPDTFRTLVRAFFNDPDPDWSVLCEECPGEEWQRDVFAELVELPDPYETGADAGGVFVDPHWQHEDAKHDPASAYYYRALSLKLEFPLTRITRVEVVDYTLLAMAYSDSTVWCDVSIAENPYKWTKNATGYHINHITPAFSHYTTRINWMGRCDRDTVKSQLGGAVYLYAFRVFGKGPCPWPE